MNSAVMLLERAALRWGGRVAVEDEWGSVCYQEYRDLSRRVGTGLLRAGAARRPVAVLLPRSIRALSVFFGAQYAGSPYVPLDYAIPLPRLEKILESLAPCALVTDAAGRARLGEAGPGVTLLDWEALAAAETEEQALRESLGAVIDTDPIYIIYTSGSTGVPKGVTIPQRGILDYAEWVVRTFGYTEETVMAAQAPFYFDNSTFDIYGSLRCGGKLLLIPQSLLLFPVRLPQYLADKGVTSIFWVPTVMINVANAGALEGVALPELRVVAFAGEVMPNRQLNIWRRALPDCRFANLYGPTEITDVCCYYIVDRAFADADPLPIGRACENMRLLILRQDGSEAAVGEQGELCVLGSGVALGYWNAPELTAKAFVPNPLTGAWPERMYRTGDQAYRDAEGLIWFCGRRDSQIKRKGNRIELGEIETAAVCVEGVENAAALFDAARERIVLFVETRGTLPFRRFNQALKQYIPAYMLPDALVPMPALPYTPNGKIDRVKLRGTLEQRKESEL